MRCTGVDGFAGRRTRLMCLLVALGLHLGVEALLPHAPSASVALAAPLTFELAALAAGPDSAAGPAAAASAPAADAPRPSRSESAAAPRARHAPRPAPPVPAAPMPAPAADALAPPMAVLAAADAAVAVATTADTVAPPTPASATGASGADSAMPGHGIGGAGSGANVGTAAATTGLGSRQHGPGLLSRGDLCAGYFPATAHVQSGVVRVLVQVDETGHARSEDVLLELPHGEGFAAAARACAARLRFAPARDPRGVAVPGQAKLELRFDRGARG